jgi:ankyrin repeat protein
VACGPYDAPLPKVQGDCSANFVAAIQRGDISAVKSALDSGENPNCSVPSEFGDSPLTVALENQRAELVQMLVQAGGQVGLLER